MDVVGDVIAGRFTIEALAGEGGMGVVYRARDSVTGEAVALKLLRGAGSDGKIDAAADERFQREAGVLTRLRHPGIVRYVAHGRTPSGQAYLAMDWLEGEELARRLSRQGLTVAETLRLARRVAGALAEAHQRGIVHRDLKPSNIFLPDGDVGRAVLLDFGVSAVRDVQTGLTRTGTVLGTPGYMAPEQTRGERTVDARADVFALGAVLFKCLTGQAAFAADTVIAQLAKVLFCEAPRVRELNDGVPEELDALVARMLSKDPSARPDDGTAVAADLDGISERPSDERVRAPASVRETHITDGEQRLVSIVLAAVDAQVEDGAVTVREQWNTLDAQRQRLRSAAQSFGAHVEALANGAVIATLRGRGSATDQAAHAARCALAMRGAAAAVPMALATAYGEIDAGVARASVADVIDRAAGLLQHALPAAGADALPASAQGRDALAGGAGGRGGRAATRSARVRVDDVTAALLDVRFQVAESEPGAFELCGERGGLDGARTLLGKATSCVGRERELAVLTSLFDEVRSEPVARAVLVSGAAGIGKSRLRYEFARAVGEREAGAQVWVARGDPMSAGAPFAMLAQALRSAIGLSGSEAIELARPKLRARVAWHVPEADVDRVAEFLGEIVDVPGEDEGRVQLRAARQDAMLMGDQMRRAFEDFLAAEAGVATVVLVLEDLHWGDLPTVRFVDSALRSLPDARLLVFALARPEVHDLFPKLWHERGLQEIRLGELTRRAAERLVREALGETVDDEQVHGIVARAAGNAFYLEEIIRSFSEGRRDALPDTVVAMVQARLETLPAPARRVLRAASVFGEVFWSGAVAAVAGAGRDVVEWLPELTHGELILRRPSSRFPGEEEYAFRHALVQEAAYSTLRRDDRALAHRLAGDWLVKVGDTGFATIAEHYERGQRPSRAREWFARAAAQALEGNDFLSTLRMAERATRTGGQTAAATTVAPGARSSANVSASAPSDGDTGRDTGRDTGPTAAAALDPADLGELRLLAAEAHAWRGEFAEARTSAREALGLLVPGSARWYAAAGEVALATSRLGDYDVLARVLELLRAHPPERRGQAPSSRKLRVAGGPPIRRGEDTSVPYIIASARTAQHLLGVGEYTLVDAVLDHLEALVRLLHGTGGTEHPDPSALAWLALARSMRSDPAASMEQAEEAIAHFERAGDRRSACLTRGNLGDANNQIGRYVEAETLLREALATAERMGLSNVAALARVNLGFCLSRLGRREEALDAVRLGASELHAQGDVRRQACAHTYEAMIELAFGDAEAARGAIDKVLPIVHATPPMRAWALAVRADIRRALGDPSSALEDAREAVDILSRLGSLDEGESLVRLAYAEALRASGDPEGFASARAAAKESLLARSRNIKDASRRRSFLESVRENAATMAL